MITREGRPESAEAARERIYALISSELDQVVLNIASVAAGRDEPQQHPEIEARLEHVLSAPGKRVRPAVTLLTQRLWGRPTDERSVSMATAVELLHIATLVHDDTVDRAATRRGRATPSSLWGGTVAVLLGDYVFASSALFVCETNSVRLIKRFAQTIAELARGELKELAGAWQPSATRAAYYERIYDKTASLFATAAESGAVLGEADEEDVQRLRSFGHSLGMAFQVYDDLLDFESTSQALGKPAGHDLPSGILTLPAIVALEGGPGRQPLLDYLGAEPSQRAALLAGTVDAVKSCGALQEVRAIAGDFSHKAMTALSAQRPSQELDCLKGLTAYLLGRRS